MSDNQADEKEQEEGGGEILNDSLTSPQVGDSTGDEFPPYCNPDYIMPHSITVTAYLNNNNQQQQQVSTFNVTIVKLEKDHNVPYYGGYRHKKSGLRYHHASAQTEGGGGPVRDVSHLRERETQTFSLVTKSVQLGREFGTQMARPDLQLDDGGDRSIIPRGYFSSNQLLDRKRKDALSIQCYWRGYTSRKIAWTIREELYQNQLNEIKKSDKMFEFEKANQKKEINRRLNPRSMADFEILYNELDVWRNVEHSKIHKLKGSGRATKLEVKEMVAQLLAKETKLLQTIDKLKAAALKLGRDKKINRMLNYMSEPKGWEGSNGIEIKVDTPFTLRARELKELYKGLVFGSNGNIDERLDVLLNVKWTVNEFDCSLTRDIVSLIDRESDLLTRGRNVNTVKGLRVRLSNLFLQFIETPEFNPESRRFLTVPNEFEVEPLYKSLAAPSNWVQSGEETKDNRK